MGRFRLREIVSTEIRLGTMQVSHPMKEDQERATPPSLIPLRPGPAGVGEKASERAGESARRRDTLDEWDNTTGSHPGQSGVPRTTALNESSRVGASRFPWAKRNDRRHPRMYPLTPVTSGIRAPKRQGPLPV